MTRSTIYETVTKSKDLVESSLTLPTDSVEPIAITAHSYSIMLVYSLEIQQRCGSVTQFSVSSIQLSDKASQPGKRVNRSIAVVFACVVQPHKISRKRTRGKKECVSLNHSTSASSS